MVGPLIPLGYIPEAWNNVIAVLLGMGFGFVLEASGFSSSRKIMGTFFGYDFVVLRVFFTASVTAMAGLLYFDYIGWIDITKMYVLPTYMIAAITGGVIMGIGFSLGGYCPGTSFCAVAIGKIDALVFTLGMLAGILLFSEAFPLLEQLYERGNLGNLTAPDALGISPGLFVFLVIMAALGMFIFATIVQRKVKKIEY